MSFSTCSSEEPDLKKRLAQLQALQRISMAMASTMKPAEIISMVFDEVVELTQASSATIFLRDQQSQKLLPQHCTGEETRPQPLDMMMGDDLVVEVAHTGAVRQVNVCEPMMDGRIADYCRVAIPLVADDDVLGVIDLKARWCKTLDSGTEELLTTLASQAAQVLHNASTHEELEQHYRELSLLYEIQQELSSTFDYQKVLILIVERTKRLFHAWECTIRLVVEHEARRLIRIVATTASRFIGPEEVLFEESQIDQLVLAGELIYMEDVRTDPRFRFKDEAVEVGVVSMLCAPLVARGRIIGTVRLYTAERREFSVSERKMLLALAGQAATALEHARLYSQIELNHRELTASYEALRRTQKELLKKERLAALGEMAATVAHEIRNPLTSVRGFAQRIARRCAPQSDKRLVEYTGIIMEEVDRLNKFIEDVLDFARRVKPSFERVNVNRVVSEIIHLMREEISEQDIVVVPDLEMNLRETVLDASLIKQTFLNVLQNARQALGKRGLIMIKTQNSGNFVRIRITDNGPGIPREILPKILSPFFTTKTQGTGLGLALAQRIIDEHHGRMLIRSRVNYGTVVDIFLPVVESEEALLALS